MSTVQWTVAIAATRFVHGSSSPASACAWCVSGTFATFRQSAWRIFLLFLRPHMQHQYQILIIYDHRRITKSQMSWKSPNLRNMRNKTKIVRPKILCSSGHSNIQKYLSNRRIGPSKQQKPVERDLDDAVGHVL